MQQIGKIHEAQVWRGLRGVALQASLKYLSTEAYLSSIPDGV